MTNNPYFNAPQREDLELLERRKLEASSRFREESNPLPYTSPRALRRLLERGLVVFPDRSPCSSHELLLIPQQNYENTQTQFVSAVCGNCHYHFHIKSDTTHCQRAGPSHPLHMLLVHEHKSNDELRQERKQFYDVKGYVRLVCIAPECHFSLEISTMPPKLSVYEVDNFKDHARVKRNLAQARRDDPERYADAAADFGTNPAGTLLRYLTDALNREPGLGPLKIKKRNKRFEVSFGTDFDPLLRNLGFEEREDEEGEPCWFISEPEEAKCPTPSGTLRARMEDARAEVGLLSNLPIEPAWNRLMQAFGGEYQAFNFDPSLTNQISGDDLETLGCLADFSPQVFSWAGCLLSDICPRRRDNYIESAFRCVRNRNEDAVYDLTMYRSQFDSDTVPHAMQDAYRFFGMDANRIPPVTADELIGEYYQRIHADPSDDNKAKCQQYLDVISSQIGQDLISQVLAADPNQQGGAPEANSSAATGAGLMSIRSATNLLGIDANFTPEMTQGFLKNLNPETDREKVGEALEVLSNLRRHQEMPADANDFASLARDFKQNGPDGLLGIALPDIQLETLPEPSTYLNAPPGLRNIGNTCYLNSLLQYFYNVKVVRDIISDLDNAKLNLDEREVAERKTGGNGTIVSFEEAIVARQFAEELRTLFEDLRTTANASAQPSQKLANTALSSAKEILSVAQHQQPPPLPARPSPAPPIPPPKTTEDADMVNVTVQPVKEHRQSSSSRSSNTLVDGQNDPPPETHIQVNDPNDTHKVELAPPPTALKSNDVAMEDTIEPLSFEAKCAEISRRLEQSDRSGTAQQDVEEIIGNILEHLMRAIRPDGPMQNKPDLQADKVTKTFFTTIVNYTIRSAARNAEPSLEPSATEDIVNEEIIPERWITAFPHPDKENKVQSDLYDALDRYFAYELLSDGFLARYTTIRSLPPILHICIQRTDASGIKNKNPVVIPETLYLDRYLETEKDSSLWGLRRREWVIKERIKQLESSIAKTSQLSIEKMTDDSWGFVEKSEGGAVCQDLVLDLNEDLLRDLGYKNPGRTAQPHEVLREATMSEQEPPNETDGSLPPSEFMEFIHDAAKEQQEWDVARLVDLRKEEREMFTSLQNEKYSLHAIICHGGGMNAGHYWVWIRDFQRKTWYKYNDSTVTEDTRGSHALLEELNNSGDPYYVAYVRDETKHELVDVPHRLISRAAEDEDVDMQVVEGIRPSPDHAAGFASGLGDLSKPERDEAGGIDGSPKGFHDDNPPYEIL